MTKGIGPEVICDVSDGVVVIKIEEPVGVFHESGWFRLGKVVEIRFDVEIGDIIGDI